ncbi:hypothetical protein CTI12_AA235790 [Artemisia annua]|uniref:Uncharacterized protein n=1 Tax=Artemisia annua TaxID=35608 RepID=A0A2U1NS16_ARTAN|nr:hypothetical protein CTI12_AA235790 [Artemisia annua]
MAASNNLEETLKPFHLRASQAEERLARLEAAFATTKVSDSGNEELLNKVAELEKRLEEAKSEQLAEREKALKEEEKLRYRITHLLRALEKADSNLATK